MPDWLYILVNITVAAFVGGITNHFAIKMLFHPREEIRIGGRRLPFTPGLIPKRKEEIAESLGKVVSDYLVTTEGLQEMIRKPLFRMRAEETVSQKLNSLTESELTLRDIALKFWSPEDWQLLKKRVVQKAQSVTASKAAAAWSDYGLEDKPIKDLIPGWSEEKRQQWSGMAADAVLKELGDTLLSSDGQRLLKEMASAMLDKAGGFLGTMAAIFVDEDKLVEKMTPMLISQLEGDKIRQLIVSVVSGKLEQYGELSIGSALQAASGESGLLFMTRKLEQFIPWESWIEQLEDIRLADMIKPRLPQVEALLPGWVDKGLHVLEDALPSAVKAVNLPNLVQEQVRKFPIERLEEVILSVSGQEFRAITWLGVLLGGFIGLFQSIITLLWR
ncbi:DUF445 domain-containing protein [Paenibacillus dakarensis]|uniref:DUF445 domain-containing protein n=1 Tax=Paenibacillus dakarensis TaxID=1527293 RepID=UPI0006D564C9|nr:DUF445 family protein [Paenibacillus dakarensis]